MNKKILLIANYAKSMLFFRLRFLIELVERGYEVVVAIPYEEEVANEFKKYNITLIPLQIHRSSLNPFLELRTILSLYKIVKQTSPDIVMLYTIKPVFYGSIVCGFLRYKNVFSMIPGLGYLFTGDSLKKKIMRFFVRLAYKFCLRYDKRIFFLNNDDVKYFLENKIISPDQSVLLNGEGVDLERYTFSAFNSNQKIIFLFSARLLKDKGICEYVNAAKIIKEKYPQVEFKVAGGIDDNPSSVSKSELDEWVTNGWINYCGYVSDVAKIIKESAVFVLPSYYREGLPVSILEAMSIGRPIITTDSPGCRETVINGVNGYLVPIKNVEKLVEAMEKFIAQPDLIVIMGMKGRRMAEEKFDVKKVNQEIFKMIEIV